MRIAFVVAGSVDRRGLESILWLIEHTPAATTSSSTCCVIAIASALSAPGRVRSGHK